MATGHSSFISFCLFSALFTAFFWSPSISLPLHSRPATKTSTEFIRSKCNSTDYPRLCIASLSSYAPTINNNPLQLADAALNVSLRSARSTATMMARLSTRRMSSREAEAVSDCIETMKDSVWYLRQSLKEMGEITKSKSQYRKRLEVMEKINDVQTWVSTALTDESTCMDEIRGNSEWDDQGVSSMNNTVKTVVRGRVVRMAQLTSNALALVDGLVQPAKSASP